MGKNTLKLVLTDHWFEEIKSGRKTHEYRKATAYWARRLAGIPKGFFNERLTKTGYKYATGYDFIEFQKAYRKNPERMTFKLLSVKTVEGIDTDLKYDGVVFDIELGDRIDE